VITGGIFLLMTILTISAFEVFGLHNNMFHTGDWNFSHHVDPGTTKNFGKFLDFMMCMSAAAIVGITAIVIFFYCLGSLYDDRKDRSILFWQSLPIANWKTVASKVASAVFIAPTIAVVLGVVTGAVLVLITACVASFHGLSIWEGLTDAHPIKLIASIIGLIPLYAVCALPTIGWLMLCSAWARSKPFLWAFIIPLATTFAVWWLHLLGMPGLDPQWFFSHVTTRVLFAATPGNWLPFIGPIHIGSQGDEVFEHLDLLHNYSALASGEVWLGAVAGVAMLAGATWLRRWRDDS
jgi:ABC-2 type transport system permease protein